jgi:RNA polymerase primary sigma factor
VRVYLRQIAANPLLTNEEEYRLTRQLHLARKRLCHEVMACGGALRQLVRTLHQESGRGQAYPNLMPLPAAPGRGRPVRRSSRHLRELERLAEAIAADFARCIAPHTVVDERRLLAQRIRAGRRRAAALAEGLGLRYWHCRPLVRALEQISARMDDLERRRDAFRGPDAEAERAALGQELHDLIGIALDGPAALRRRVTLMKRSCAEYERHRSALATANLRLVVSIAKWYRNHSLNLLDLIQEGNLGLMAAIDRYEINRDCRFATYATWWIRQRIGQALADRSRLIRLPAHGAVVAGRLRDLAKRFLHERGREATVEELAHAAGIDAERARCLLCATRFPASLDRPVSVDGEGRFADLLADGGMAAPGASLDCDARQQGLTRLLQMLTCKQREIIRLRYGLGNCPPCTLEQIGRVLGISRERVRQVEADALAKLRNAARGRLHEDLFGLVTAG